MALPQSDSELVLLHNPRCSKSRAARALLEERGVDFGLRLYLEEPLSRAELADLRARLGRPVREWTRRGEAAFRESGLGGDAGDDELLDLMAEHPVVMERPILVRGRRAAVGRPTESLLPLLQEAE
jgi:arsenate reductase